MKAFANADDAVETWRKTVTAKFAGQQTYLKSLARHDVVFGIGPAGSGKTYLPLPRPLKH